MTDDRRTPSSGEVYAALVRVAHCVAQEGAQELRAYGLTPAQYQVLVAAHQRAGVTQQALVERLGVTKGAVSQLVARLDDAGLLRRVPVGASNELTLTEQGRALVTRLIPAHRAFLDRRFAGLAPHERATLLDLLHRLTPGC
ncbi:MarR family winged helix-turn-helix transcriptional regulator [Micromonospora sp. BQ11]|uniref:MarR family winged helix-turn-helix transcriptional regulator n=1 Tax=Micromonospora sp. BQ11 TaxID=3452212 RepID=UPI003F8C90C6